MVKTAKMDLDGTLEKIFPWNFVGNPYLALLISFPLEILKQTRNVM